MTRSTPQETSDVPTPHLDASAARLLPAAASPGRRSRRRLDPRKRLLLRGASGRLRHAAPAGAALRHTRPRPLPLLVARAARPAAARAADRAVARRLPGRGAGLRAGPRARRRSARALCGAHPVATGARASLASVARPARGEVDLGAPGPPPEWLPRGASPRRARVRRARSSRPWPSRGPASCCVPAWAQSARRASPDATRRRPIDPSEDPPCLAPPLPLDRRARSASRRRC